ncbi:hypothetical protein AB0D15_16565, partial [Streptomyces sp. NPDC048551]
MASSGPEAEPRRLTGARGPARAEVVQDGECGRVEEITLGGRTVRGGHGAVLTGLEWGMRILAPVGELVARAVKHPDEEHVDRSEPLWVLLRRQSAQTWSEVAAFHRHPSPAHRAFAAEFLSAGCRVQAARGSPSSGGARERRVSMSFQMPCRAH